MTPETPVNAGHSYATAAEDYEDREEWGKAAEAHSQAAEQFEKAIEYTEDPVARESLRLLSRDHVRKAKDLQRKSQKKQPHAGSFDMEGLRLALPTTTTTTTDKRHGYSTPAIGGSYAVLPSEEDEDEEEEDASDPFNKFWKAVETLVDKLSNPVAFASVPLNEHDNPSPAWKTAEADEDAGSMFESYLVVPHEHRPGQIQSCDQYAAENERLKKHIEQLNRRIQSLEKAAEESNMLKSSIIQFRNDVHKQAKRIMQSHDYTAMRASSTAAFLTASTTSARSYIRPPTGGLVARIKELEEENRQLRLQNEKQQALMNKYRERWEKLKESAKKRRAQPEQSSSSASQSSSSSSSNQVHIKSSSCSTEYTRQPTLLRSLARQSTSSSSTSAFPAFIARRASTETSGSKSSLKE